MKKLLLLTLLLQMIGCMPARPEGKFETVEAYVHITEVYSSKHSRVRGYIIYNNLTLPCRSNTTGRKHYRLHEGDSILAVIRVYTQPYNDNRLMLETTPFDVTEYEIH